MNINTWIFLYVYIYIYTYIYITQNKFFRVVWSGDCSLMLGGCEVPFVSLTGVDLLLPKLSKSPGFVRSCAGVYSSKRAT